MGKPAGRQPLPKAERRSERIFVYVTPAEYRAVKTHRKRGQTISDFVRDAIIAALRPTPEPSPPPADGGHHIADPPHTAHGGGPAHGGARIMGPSTPHHATPQQQHGAPGPHSAQGSPYIADPPPADLDGPAPAVTAEEVKRRLTQAGVEGWQAFTAADKDPQRVADILDRAGGLSPSAIFNRIVRPGA